MRRELLITAALGLALTGAACSDGTDNEAADQNAMTQSDNAMDNGGITDNQGMTPEEDTYGEDDYAMDDNATNDNGIGQSEAVNNMQDAASAPVGMTSAATMGGDTESFIKAAAIANEYEIKAAEIALRKSTNQDVKDLAQTILDDHQALGEEFMTVLEGAGLMAPTGKLDNRRQGLIDNLEVATGDDFDETYLDQQIDAHQETLTLFKAQADRGDVPQLADLADGAVATLQSHLDQARAVEDMLPDEM